MHVQKAIERLKTFEPPEGYYLAFSGGKDSQAIYRLAQMAGIKFDAHYHITTVDPPELVRFVIEKYPDVERIRPRISMWKLIEKNRMPPMRKMRYCCRELKERGGENRVVVTGVRWAESSNRKAKRAPAEFHTYKDHVLLNDNTDDRRMFETCKIKSKRIVNPIIEWTEEQVWDFVKKEIGFHCELYDRGFHRLGCIACPMGRRMKKIMELNMWPRFKNLYMKSFQNVCEQNPGLYPSAEYMMEWFLSDTSREQFDRDRENKELF